MVVCRVEHRADSSRRTTEASGERRCELAAECHQQRLAQGKGAAISGMDMYWADHQAVALALQAQNMLRRQWEGLEQAPDGSIRNRLHR